MRLTVVGNPGNRRVEFFRAAVAQAGWPEPVVVPWAGVAAGSELRIPEHSWVRVESPGEDPTVDRQLRGVELLHGELAASGRWFAGFAQALGRVGAAADAARARLLNPVAEVLTLFDKAACHARLSTLGIPVPPALPQVDSWESLRRHAREAGWSGLFVKPRFGSSASGVIALRLGKAGRVRGMTSVELRGPRMFNSLRVRTYEREADLAAIVDRLAADVPVASAVPAGPAVSAGRAVSAGPAVPAGPVSVAVPAGPGASASGVGGGVHVERWFPKAGLGGRSLDLRVVVIGGRVSHVVPRTSSSPMTNLHLGGLRGDLGQVRAAAGERGWAQAMETCERVAAAFPGSLQVGVDLMFSSDWRRHAVAEVNAFGDLLPGWLVEGRDTYAAQVEVMRRWACAS